MDDELKGSGNSYDFGARIYDSRLGRFLSLDPLIHKFPNKSPYVFAANTPIVAIDEEGKYSVWAHYKMTYKALRKFKYSKKFSSEIAHYASTYADHPTTGILIYNQSLALDEFWDPTRLSYDTEKYGSYEKTKDSQSDLLVAAVSIHAMKTYWEDITDEEAVNRALYGGTFKEKDGSTIVIVGAYEIIEKFKGRSLEDLSQDEKKLLGLALHTIQDAQVHKGKRWVNDHKKEAEKMGHENEHPNVDCCVLETNSKKAKKKTQEVVEMLYDKDPEKKYYDFQND